MVQSKVFDHIFSPVLTAHLICKGFSPDYQCASKSSSGVSDLVKLDHLLQNSLDQGCEARVLQLDFPAAYDRVNDLRLLYKLRNAGVGDGVLG